MKIGELGEFGLINRITKALPPLSKNVVKGIGDDTAVIRPPEGKLLLMAADMLVQDIHFSLQYASLEAVGWKALAVNMSDIAAMGGRPGQAVVSVAVPADFDVSQMETLYEGLGNCARAFGCDIVGGDTVKSLGGLMIDVSIIGFAEPERIVYRSGAKPGDVVMVTGPLGSSAAGLFALNNQLPDIAPDVIEEAVKAHLFPRPRKEEGPLLAEAGLATAMNDISDGLASELIEICQASGVGCEIDYEAIPYTEAAGLLADRAGVTPRHWALCGGEDYELVFTVKKEQVQETLVRLKASACQPIAIGRIVPKDSGCVIVDRGIPSPLKPAGYNHFI